MKASGVMSLGMVEPEGLRKSAGAGREGILHRSVCEPLAPDSLSELNTSMLKSVKGSANPEAQTKNQNEWPKYIVSTLIYTNTHVEQKIMKLSSTQLGY